MNSFVLSFLIASVCHYLDLYEGWPAFEPGEHDITCIRNLEVEPIEDIERCLFEVGFKDHEIKSGVLFQNPIKDFFIWQSEEMTNESDTVIIININPR